jgi:5-methylcytosine-specific restriction endonuclease McrA
LIAGRLNERQATEIASAAEADPTVEEKLIDMAQHESIAALREKCRDVRAAAGGDEDARERIRRSRYFRHWLEDDGAMRMDARLTVDEGAPLLATIRARADALQEEARRAGQTEPAEAYAADALVSLASGEKGSRDKGPRAIVHVHVSRSALDRGHTEPGETSHIPGAGPITIAAARRLAATGSVRVIESDGVDVQRVTHAGRAIPAHLRSALEARDPSCVVPGCNKRRDLEIDHILPVASGGQTELANLARLCRWHHAQKTHHGWTLEGAPGAWRWHRGKPRSAQPALPTTDP